LAEGVGVGVGLGVGVGVGVSSTVGLGEGYGWSLAGVGVDRAVAEFGREQPEKSPPIEATTTTVTATSGRTRQDIHHSTKPRRPVQRQA
jgi:hypothetical protein